jgi:helicase
LSQIVDKFNHQTKDGKEMVVYSELLQEAIDQLMEHDQISTMDALFNFGSVDLMNTSIEGMDDFELICFFILMKGDSDD